MTRGAKGTKGHVLLEETVTATHILRFIIIATYLATHLLPTYRKKTLNHKPCFSITYLCYCVFST